MRKLTVYALVMALILSFIPLARAEEAGTRSFRLLFTHDIHSYLELTVDVVNGVKREHGGAARLAALIKEYRTENSLYMDGGDFSQGTLFQAGYVNSAYELRALGLLGCDATTFGNHEWDNGGTGLAKMLLSANASGDPLPLIVQSNLDFSGELTNEQRDVMNAMETVGAVETAVLTLDNGLRIGVFGLMGIEAIEDSPTSGMKWKNYITAAKDAVKELDGKCDLIICLSHSGTTGDGKTGEDFDLIKEVPGIDFVLSAHSHTSYPELIMSGDTALGSAGSYLENLGVIDFEVSGGEVRCVNYELVPIDGTAGSDAGIEKAIDGFKEEVTEGYLAGAGFDSVIAHISYDMMTLDDMYAVHDEYPLGDLIADSYMYAARQSGINDVNVCVVALGTIRGSLSEGDITTAKAFEICSLGMGSDGTAGHPLVAAYITGSELKLLAELDASLGPIKSDIKMSYSGLEFKFNTKRVLLDRVTEIRLVRADGTYKEIDDDKYYKVVANMYAVNMLGMLNGLTKGILSITMRDGDGNVITDNYAHVLRNPDGSEIKEWRAFADYISSFDKNADGVSEIPESYAAKQGRKVKYTKGGFAVISNPGATTIAAMSALPALALIVFLITLGVRRRRRNNPKELRQRKWL